MQADYDAGLFSSDDLLARVQAGLSNFYWQSHTLTHLARDNLGVNDCDIEDGGEPARNWKCCTALLAVMSKGFIITSSPANTLRVIIQSFDLVFCLPR